MLSGQFSSHNIATTTLCGQILSDLKPSVGIIQEWKEIDDLQKAALQHNGYEPCNNEMVKDNKLTSKINNATSTPTIPVATLKGIKQKSTEEVIKN